jgi:hypothetical protein
MQTSGLTQQQSIVLHGRDKILVGSTYFVWDSKIDKSCQLFCTSRFVPPFLFYWSPRDVSAAQNLPGWIDFNLVRREPTVSKLFLCLPASQPTFIRPQLPLLLLFLCTCLMQSLASCLACFVGDDIVLQADRSPATDPRYIKQFYGFTLTWILYLIWRGPPWKRQNNVTHILFCNGTFWLQCKNDIYHKMRNVLVSASASYSERLGFKPGFGNWLF